MEFATSTQPDDTELRYEDYSLSEDEALVRGVVARFLAAECSLSVVRAAEPLGFDRSLWTRIARLGYLYSTAGDDGRSMADLVLVAQECGRVLAPLPFVETMVARRLLSGCLQADDARELLDDADIVSLALHPERLDARGARQLIPAGAVADAVIYLRDDQLVLRRHGPLAQVPNLAGAPQAWSCDAHDDTRCMVLARGEQARALFTGALEDWKLLTAAALTGLGQAAAHLGIEFVKTRSTRGTPIGSLQGIAFPLTQAEIMTTSAQGLVWKAAWFRDHEPASRPELTAMALAHAMRAAVFVTETSLHVQGAFGFTVEANIGLYLRRAKAWVQIGTTEEIQLQFIGDLLADRWKCRAGLSREGAGHGLQ